MGNVTGFNIYGSISNGPIWVSPQNRSFVANVGGGWGYGFTVAAVYDDGAESFSSEAYVIAPMCEGGFIDPLVIILPMAFLSIFLLAFIIVWNQRRKRE